jgi:hypothetical protein
VRETERFERLAITTPESAAERIVRGMLRDEPRATGVCFAPS